MTATQETISRLSRFLVGVATAAIVLQAIVHITLGYKVNETSTGVFTIGEWYSVNWIFAAMGELRGLSYLLLCGWIGQLLQYVRPNPSRGLRIFLIVVAIIGAVWYGFWHAMIHWPSWYYWTMMLSCIIWGYLMPVETIRQHSKAELITLSILMAFFYAACFGLTRHAWAQIPAAIGFIYYMILLSRDPDIQQFMAGRWVKPTLIILSVLAFLITLRSLILDWNLMNIFNLSYTGRLLVQPVIVYPFIWIWRKKHPIS